MADQHHLSLGADRETAYPVRPSQWQWLPFAKQETDSCAEKQKSQ
jgi:hypothetical protein